MMKICVIGCGNHASEVHGPSYLKYRKVYPDTEFVACCDLDKEKGSQFKEKFGFKRSYTDFNIMLDNEKPDAVCVLVPEKHVCETSINVMEKGYAVLLEKPPGLNKEETKRMMHVAEKTGATNQVAFNRRHIPLLKMLKEKMIYHIGSNMQSIFYEFYRVGRRESHFETTAIHGIDAVKHIAGAEYSYIHFMYQEMPHLGNKVANIFLDCTFENGMKARLNFCPCSGMVVERMTVNAYDHTFMLHTPIWDGFDAPGKLIHVHHGKLESEISGSEMDCGQRMFETNGFYEENRIFFENVRYGIKSLDDISSGFQSVEIAEYIQQRKTEYMKS